MATDDDRMIDQLEWDGDEHMRPEELHAAQSHREQLTARAEQFQALSGEGVSAHHLADCLRAWWQTLAAITALHDLGDSDALTHTGAFSMWWAREMNLFAVARTALYSACAAELGLDIPQPEDLEAGGRLTLDGRDIGAFGFCFVLDGTPTQPRVPE